MRDKILLGIILFGMVFYFVIMPVTVAYGVISGRLDIETLEPAGCVEEEHREMGGY